MTDREQTRRDAQRWVAGQADSGATAIVEWAQRWLELDAQCETLKVQRDRYRSAHATQEDRAEQAERARNIAVGEGVYLQHHWTEAERRAVRAERRLAKVPALVADAHSLAKWTSHSRNCARVLDADECDCGLNDAWRRIEAWLQQLSLLA